MSGANIMDPSLADTVIQQLQKAGTARNVGDSISATFGATPTENNLLIAIVCMDVPAKAINVPAGWTQVHNITGAKADIAYFYKLAGAAESATVTVTFTAVSALANLEILEYEGITPTSPLDVSASLDSGAAKEATCPSGTTAATAQANSLAVSGHNFTKNVSTTAYTNSFVEQSAQGNDGDEIFLGVAHKILTATGTQDTTFSVASPTAEHIGVIAVFKGFL